MGQVPDARFSVEQQLARGATQKQSSFWPDDEKGLTQPARASATRRMVVRALTARGRLAIPRL
jgi:hypothetical protein